MKSINPQIPAPLILRGGRSPASVYPQSSDAFAVAKIYLTDPVTRRRTETHQSTADLMVTAYNTFDQAARALNVDAHELAVCLDIPRVVQILDRLSALVEDGRLKQACSPEEYDWFVESLARASSQLPVGR